MRLSVMYIGIVFLGISLSSRAPSSPSTLEILNSLETSLVDRDKNRTMALFADDAVIIGSQGQREFEGIA
jgi:hypothetical protein